MPRRIRVPYVSDDGTTYQRRTWDDLATSLGLPTEALGAHMPLPRSIKPRYILGVDPANGRAHRLTGLAPTNTLWTGTVNTITVPDPGNRTATLTLNIGGRVAEKRYVR